jgi:hypothetical protein
MEISTYAPYAKQRLDSASTFNIQFCISNESYANRKQFRRAAGDQYREVLMQVGSWEVIAITHRYSGAIAEYSPMFEVRPHYPGMTPLLFTTEIPWMGGAWLICR